MWEVCIHDMCRLRRLGFLCRLTRLDSSAGSVGCSSFLCGPLHVNVVPFERITCECRFRTIDHNRKDRCLLDFHCSLTVCTDIQENVDIFYTDEILEWSLTYSGYDALLLHSIYITLDRSVVAQYVCEYVCESVLLMETAVIHGLDYYWPNFNISNCGKKNLCA